MRSVSRSKAREEWLNRLKAQQKSGESIPTWCARMRVNAKYFYAWRKRLGSEVDLVPVRVKPSPAQESLPLPSAMSLVLHVGSVRLEMSGVDSYWLSGLLKGLQ
jgi:hypothetical protein